MEFLPALVSAGISIGSSLLGAFKPGSSGSDPQYVADVNAERQREYGVAQEALSKVTVPAAQQAIVAAYNQEQALWGDPNKPNRNVARPDLYKAKVAEIVGQYQTTSVLPAVNNVANAVNSVTSDANTALNNFVNSLNSALPLLGGGAQTPATQTNYIPMILIGAILILLLMKGKK